jgi:hypothetical protein
MMIGTLPRSICIFGLASLGGLHAMAQETADAQAAASQRLAFMEKVVTGYEFSSEELPPDSAGTFVRKALLRYSDPTRDLMDAKVSGLIDAGVWRLGKDGRPTALVVLEIYRSADGKGTLAHEFLSLAEKKFSLAHKDYSVQWDATGTDLKLAAFEDAPSPAKTATARLVQMRQLARRFTAKETINDNVIECRLMSSPIDRYESAADGILDGAIFAYANGTNPEVGIVVEADKGGWKFGVVRLGAAKATVTLDGREVASFPFFGEYGRRDGVYTSTSHAVELPQ